MASVVIPSVGSENVEEKQRTDRHPIAAATAFVALTYAWTWSINLLQMPRFGSHHFSGGATTLAHFAPAIVAFVVAGSTAGVAGVRVLFRKLRPRLRDLWLSIAAAAIVVVLAGSAFEIYVLWSGLHPALGPVTNLFGMLLVLIPLTGFFEETGWRGFLLDRLECRVSPLTASLLVGLIWGIWHIPTYLRLQPEGEKTPQLIMWFLIGTVPVSLLFSALYHFAERRLLPVIVLHAATDSAMSYFFGPVQRGDLRGFALWTVIALIVSLPAGFFLTRPEPGYGGDSLIS